MLSTEALGVAANIAASAAYALENVDDALVDGFRSEKSKSEIQQQNSPSLRTQTKAASRASDAGTYCAFPKSRPPCVPIQY